MAMQTHDAETSAMWAPIMTGDTGAIQAAQTDAKHTPAPVYVHKASVAHVVTEWVSKALRLCGHGSMRTYPDGRDMTPTARFADWFWPSNDCACCWWFRGVALGLAVGVVAGSIITAAIAAII